MQERASSLLTLKSTKQTWIDPHDSKAWKIRSTEEDNEFVLQSNQRLKRTTKGLFPKCSVKCNRSNIRWQKPQKMQSSTWQKGNKGYKRKIWSFNKFDRLSRVRLSVDVSNSPNGWWIKMKEKSLKLKNLISLSPYSRRITSKRDKLWSMQKLKILECRSGFSSSTKRSSSATS